MEYRVLGSLEVSRGDGPLALGGPKQRALLALLLVNANRVVARGRLVDELWGEGPPDTAVKTTQVYVSRLRKLLPDGVLLTRAPGYVLAVEPGELDLARFERLVAEARGAVPSQASRLLREALALWRGPPLAEFDEPFARAEGGRLEDLRLAALEERIEAELALGLHAELVGELELLVAEQPHRERLRAQLMLALYRCGRQADALTAFRDARAALDELGLEPSAKLRELEKQVLTQDQALDLAAEIASIALPGSLVTSSPFPFVGRAREMTTLRSLFGRAERGEGGLVLLSGEPGGGKTRLVREFSHEAAERGSIVCYGMSDPSVTVPYQPLLEWLEHLLRVCDADALRSSLGDDGATLARLLPAFAGLTTAAESASAPDASTDRFLLQSSVGGFLRRLSELRPLLLVAEDIHWADAETLFLLTRLGRIAPAARVLVVASFRQPGEEIGRELADTLAALSRLDGVTRIALDNLSAGDVGAFVRDATDADASADLVAAIGDLTDGTPLLVCELWRELVASNAIAVADSQVNLVQPVAQLRSPERIGELVDQRLSRLSPVTAMLIELGAVSGPQFELRVVADAAEFDQPALATAVEQANRSGIIEELPAPVPSCRFTHELLRRAVYDRIGSLRRPELHLRIGEALERTHAADAELAYHFTIAAPLAGAERGVGYNVRAADAAVAALAYDEAAARLSSALDLGIPDPSERTRVQVELGLLLHQTAHESEAEAILSASLNAATGLEERGLATRALIHLSAERLSSDPRVSSPEILPIAEEAIKTFEELDDPLGLAEAELLLGHVLEREGRGEESFAALDRALVHAVAAGSHVVRRHVVAYIGMQLCQGSTPAPAAIERLQQLRRASLDDPMQYAGLGRLLASVLAMAGRFDEARELISASTRVLDGADQTILSSASRRDVAEAKDLLGDSAGAKQDALDAFLNMRDARGETSDARALRAAAQLALLCCDQGDWDEAAEFLSYGSHVDQAGPVKGKVYSALRLTARARVAAHRGDLDEALELAEQAVEFTDGSSWLNYRAGARVALAEVQRARGRQHEADIALAEAVRLYEAKGNVAAVARLNGSVA